MPRKKSVPAKQPTKVEMNGALTFPSTEKPKIVVVAADTVHELIKKVGHEMTIDFLVKISHETVLGDHLLIGYIQLCTYMEFRKLGITYTTEDPEQYKQWASSYEFSRIGTE